MYQSRRPRVGKHGRGMGHLRGLAVLLAAASPLVLERAHAASFDEPQSTVSVLAEDGLADAAAAAAADDGSVTISDGGKADTSSSFWPTFATPCPDGSDCDPWRIGDCLESLRCRKKACWIGRADALLAWRNAPPYRPLIDAGDGSAPVLNANQLDSTAAAGPRVAILREDYCTGNAWEVGYLRAANFRSQRILDVPQYALAPPGIYNNVNLQPFDTGTVNLGSMIQGLEVNHYRRLGQNVRWLAGFRWIEWQEQFTLQDQVTTVDPVINDFYQTKCVNDLYGGQIGADARVLSFTWLRVDSVVKAGAYYNNAVQSSVYTTDDPANPGTASVAVGQSPASCGFVGEVGITGAIPITSWLDFRIGYVGLWLSGIAQPTQQLSGQTLTPGFESLGSLSTNGGVLVQGITIGLEGRW